MIILVDEPDEEAWIQGPAEGGDASLVVVAWRSRPDGRAVLTVSVPGPEEEPSDMWEFDPARPGWVAVEPEETPP